MSHNLIGKINTTKKNTSDKLNLEYAIPNNIAM